MEAWLYTPDVYKRQAPSGSNQQENENYDWIPFSDNPAEHFRIAYNKPVSYTHLDVYKRQPQVERQETDEEETTADRWNA